MRRLKVEEKRVYQSHVYKNAGGDGEWGEGGREEERGGRGGKRERARERKRGRGRNRETEERERGRRENPLSPGKSQRQVAH